MPRDFLSKEEILTYLDELATALAANGVDARIYIVGGAAMVVAFDARPSTRDVDAAYLPTEEVDRVADEIGTRFDIGFDWLNNAAAQFLPVAHPENEIPSLVLQYGGVRIEFASATDLMAMKINAARRRDRKDIEVLREQLQIATLDEALELFRSHYPRKELGKDALEFLREIFEKPLPNA